MELMSQLEMQEIDDMPTDQIMFPEPTTELSAFDVGVDAMAAAVALELGLLLPKDKIKTATDRARARIYGGSR